MSNLHYDLGDSDLAEIFGGLGTVESAVVDRNVRTGRSTGRGVVEMPDDGEAGNAISYLHGSEVHGRQLIVSEAAD